MNTHFTILKKLKTAILAAGLVFPALLSAQDYIHTVDTPKPIAAKVTEISEDQVTYKAFDNPDGPVYKISAWRVLKIVFENGKEQILAKASPYSGLPYAGPAYGTYGSRYDGYGRHHPSCRLDYRNGHWYCEHERMSRAAISDYIGRSLYGDEYRKAHGSYVGGLILTMTGSMLLVTAVSLGCIDASMARFEREHFNGQMPGGQFPGEVSGRDGSSIAAPLVTGILGSACLGAGIPLIVRGKRGFRRIADDYNRTYLGGGSGGTSGGQEQTGPALFLGPAPNGIGLRLDF